MFSGNPCRYLPVNSLLVSRKQGRNPSPSHAHLLCLDQPVQRCQRLGDGRLPVGAVELVKVNAVGPQAAQAVLGPLPYIFGVGSLALVVVHGQARPADRRLEAVHQDGEWGTPRAAA